MNREPHIVSKVGNGKPWDAYVYLQATVERNYNSESDETGEYVMSGWNSIIWVPGETEAMEQCDRDYMGDCYAIDVMADAVIDRGNVLVISEYAREMAAIVGLWDMVMSGRVRLSNEKNQTQRNRGSVASERRDGMVVLAGPPTIIEFWVNGGDTKFTMLDPANHGARRYIGFGKMTDGRGGVVPPWECPCEKARKLLSEWCRYVRDWHDTYTACLSTIGTVPMRLTGAIQAQDCYRSGYMDERIYVHDSDAVLKLEREAMHGGRNECYFIGSIYSGNAPADVVIEQDDEDNPVIQGDVYGPTGPKQIEPHIRGIRENAGTLYHLDVNSLYPSVARGAMLPTKLIGVARSPSVASLIDACQNVGVIADVRVKVDDPVVPISHDGRQVFPTGEFRTTLCGPEILLARDHGHIVACHQLAYYESRPIYRRFVDRLWRLRSIAIANGDESLSSCIKNLLNCSFGRWARRAKRWLSVPVERCPQPWFQWTRSYPTEREFSMWQDAGFRVPEDWIAAKWDGLTQWRAFAWAVQFEADMGEPGDSMPAITAYVMSHGRVRLWEIMRRAGRENVFYCDTDSVIVSSAGCEALAKANEIDGAALGKLKAVWSGNYAEILGQKTYVIDKKVVAGANAANPCKVGDTFAVHVATPPIGHYLRHGEAPGLDLVQVRRRLRREYIAGHVQADGSVTPVRLADR